MANVFEVTDPRGRRIFCTEETWENHILTGHPIMEGQENAVQAAIQKPTIGIFRDAHFENREVYYLLKQIAETENIRKGCCSLGRRCRNGDHRL